MLVRPESWRSDSFLCDAKVLCNKLYFIRFCIHLVILLGQQIMKISFIIISKKKNPFQYGKSFTNFGV